MSGRSAIFALAGVQLRRLARDRLGLVFTVALPFTIILLVGLAFGGDDGPAALGVAVEGSAEAKAERVVAALEDEPALEVVRVADVAILREQVQGGRFSAGLVLTGDEMTAPPIFLTPADASRAAAVRPVVGAVLARLSEHAAEPADVTVVRLGETTATGELPRFGYTAAANLVLFTFITSLSAAAGLVEARQLGVNRRLRAAPVPSRHLLAGEALGRLLIAGLQAIVVVAGAALLFGVRWGDPAGVVVVVAAFAVVATAAGLQLGTVLRTPQQASAIGPMTGIALGMLGGCMWPLEIVGPAMRVVGHLTPHAWAVDALVALGGQGANVADVLANVAVLLAFAAVLLPLAMWRLARSS